MLLLRFVSDFYNFRNKFVKHSLFFFDIVRSLNTKHSDYTFFLYSLKNKDSLVEPLLYLYKNEEEKCCFWDLTPTFTNLQTNL